MDARQLLRYGVRFAIALMAAWVVFMFIADPEGPNLVVVIGLAVLIFFCALVVRWLVDRLIQASVGTWFDVCFCVVISIVLVRLLM